MQTALCGRQFKCKFAEQFDALVSMWYTSIVGTGLLFHLS